MSTAEVMKDWNRATQTLDRLKRAEHLLFLAVTHLPVNHPVHQRIEAFLQENP